MKGWREGRKELKNNFAFAPVFPLVALVVGYWTSFVKCQLWGCTLQGIEGDIKETESTGLHSQKGLTISLGRHACQALLKILNKLK